MKKFAFFTFIFITSLSSYAQVEEQQNHQPLTLEFDLGANYLVFNHACYDTKVGYGVSIKRIWFSDKRLNLVSGLLFEKTKYFTEVGDIGRFYSDRDMTFNYYTFSVPLLIRAYPLKRNHLFIEIGPSIEFTPVKWGKGDEYLFQPMEDNSVSKISGDFNHQFLGFGATIGLGYKFHFKKQVFVVSASYHNSIHALFNSKPYDLDQYANELKQYFTLKVGLIINEKK